MEDKKYDVIVVGGGPIGLSTAYECAKANKKVLVLEKSVFFNQSGSSGDIVRMFRTAYTEDFMADLAYQSMALWDTLETEAGTRLREMSGLLNFGDPHYGEGGPEGTLEGPIKNLDRYKMQYTRLTREEIMAQHPFRDLPENWVGISMKDNGCINVPLLLRSLFKLCKDLGVDLVQYADVKQIALDPDVADGWTVSGLLGTELGSSVAPNFFKFHTTKIAITAGAFVNHILYPSFKFSLNVDIWEMVYAYYAVDPNVTFPQMWFQFADDTKASHQDSRAYVKSSSPGGGISNLFYGFPSVPWGPPNIARIAVDTATQIVKDPDFRTPSEIDSNDLQNTLSFVSRHVKGIGPNPIPIFAGQCLQTNVYDNMFVLDYIPEYLLPPNAGPGRKNSIAVFTAGWAMKFVPLLGTVMKKMLVDGETGEYDISQFKMDRKGDKPEQHIVQRQAPMPADAVKATAAKVLRSAPASSFRI